MLILGQMTLCLAILVPAGLWALRHRKRDRVVGDPIGGKNGTRGGGLVGDPVGGKDSIQDGGS